MLTPYFVKQTQQTEQPKQPKKLLKSNNTPSIVSHFKSNQLRDIYNFPNPNPSTKIVVGVISFGGGLVGTVSPAGVLTNGDPQAHWAYLGIPVTSFPQVIIVPLNGATNSPNPSDGATIENTIDVETIGAMCPSANLTIILYIIPNTFDNFPIILNAALNPVVVDGVSYIPSVISCSWGASEVFFSRSQLTAIDFQLARAASNGVVVTAATGDNGSSNGLSTGNNVDFPSSSPNTLACGGTRLVCPKYVYDSSTVETAWTLGGGGVSAFFSKPSWQSAIPNSTGRNTPDIALVADPNTGVIFTVGGAREIVGGTSIVAPAMAAFLAIVNVKTFITPLLYTFGESNFRDITAGSNGGYMATIRYDNCTGLGSIMGTNLLNSITNTVAPSVPSVPSVPSEPAPTSTTIAVTDVALAVSTLAMSLQQEHTLSYRITPSNATNQSVAFSSNNPIVASVSSSGVITARANGTTIITVATLDGNRTARVTITVRTSATGVSLSATTLNLNVGNTETILATVNPSTASNKSVAWRTSNASIASVNSRGIVTAIANGTATVTVTSFDGNHTASCIVTVTTSFVSVSSIVLNTSMLSLNMGATASLIATIFPTNATNKAVQWTSTNPAVFTVNNMGFVTAKGGGSASIIATSVAGNKTATARVKVITPIVSIYFGPPRITLTKNNFSQSIVVFTPATSQVPVTIWQSDNPLVATVNSTGLVRAVNKGIATISISVNGRTASRVVTVL
jgi:uncharacterized protein YjdB